MLMMSCSFNPGDDESLDSASVLGRKRALEDPAPPPAAKNPVMVAAMPALHHLLQGAADAPANGPPIDDATAEVAKVLFTVGLTRDRLQDGQGEYPAPANAPFLSAPRCNEEIWRKVTRKSQDADRKLQRIQSSFLFAARPLCRILQEIHTDSDLDKDRLASHLGDALAFLGDACIDINARRRELLLPDLNPGMRQGLKGVKTQAGDLLFGGNLAQLVAEIEATNKVAKALGGMAPKPVGGGALPQRHTPKAAYSVAARVPRRQGVAPATLPADRPRSKSGTAPIPGKKSFSRRGRDDRAPPGRRI